LSSATLPRESIEGARLEGFCRKPLKELPVKRSYTNRLLYQTELDHNVNGKILKELPAETVLIEKNAFHFLDDRVICDKAVATSLKRNRRSTKVKEGVTGTHGATVWNFQSQTNILVTTAHRALEDAQKKRKITTNPK